MPIETQDDVNKFIAFINLHGGVVLKVLELRQGYEFHIQAPIGESTGWADRMMKDYYARA